MKTRTLLIITILFLQFAISFGQSRSRIESLISTPRNYEDFILLYDKILPSKEFNNWDNEFNNLLMTYNPIDEFSICQYQQYEKLHVRLDSSTWILDPQKIIGIWRMVLNRTFKIIDSISYESQKVYRTETLINLGELDDAFVVLTNERYIEYFQHQNKSRYKGWNFKYKVVDGRFLEFNKFGMIFCGTYLIGLDKNGYLILEYADAKYNQSDAKYKSVSSYIEQMIFEKIE